MSVVSRLNDLSVGLKLSLGFLMVFIFSAIIIVVGWSTMSAYNQRSFIVGEASSAESYLLDARIQEKNFQVRLDPIYIDAAKESAENAASTLSTLKEVLKIESDHQRVDRVVEGVDVYKRALTDLESSVLSNVGDLNSIEERLVEIARENVEVAVELQEVQLNRMEEQYKSAIASFLGIGFFALVFAGIVAWVLVRAVTKPIRASVTIAKRVASGDLTVEVDATRQDEFGNLFAAFKTMIDNLRDLIGQIDHGATNIASSSEELATVTSQTSQGVNEQSEKSDSVATAMSEMVSTVAEVAKSAEAAFNSAQRADETASDGQEAVNETTSLVTELHSKCNEVMEQLRTLQKDTGNIESMLNVIKNVAEQTNLLALNAAIEAARAGEQGRGFAVVADEVRSLAKRTQTSATEIDTLVTSLLESSESSVEKMESSTNLAGKTLASARKTGEKISEIVDVVEDIRQHNSQIATAADQQTSVAEEINSNITLIRDISAQSADATEQISSSSDDLAQLAEKLSIQVSRFKL